MMMMVEKNQFCLEIMSHGQEDLMHRDHFNQDDDEGKLILASAKAVLASIDKKDAKAISVADTANALEVFNKRPFNGDGVLTVESATEADAKRSPGRLARHYSPKAPVRLNVSAPEPGEAYLAFGPGDYRWNLSPSGDLREAAAHLFAYLRDADRTDPAAIAVAPIPDEGLGEAINDRLKRAAGFVG